MITMMAGAGSDRTINKNQGRMRKWMQGRQRRCRCRATCQNKNKYWTIRRLKWRTLSSICWRRVVSLMHLFNPVIKGRLYQPILPDKVSSRRGRARRHEGLRKQSRRRYWKTHQESKRKARTRSRGTSRRGASEVQRGTMLPRTTPK